MLGGNISHVSMGLDQMFWLRPAANWARHRTPVRNLFMCGAGTHPGGGVMGSAGRNAAKILTFQRNADVIAEKIGKNKGRTPK